MRKKITTNNSKVNIETFPYEKQKAEQTTGISINPLWLVNIS